MFLQKGERYTHNLYQGLTGGSDGKEPTCSAGHLGLIPGLGRFPGAGHGNPHNYYCLENTHGQRSLVGYSPWGCKELDMTERLHFPLCYGVRKCSNFILSHVAVQFSQHHLLKRLSLPHCMFLPPLSKVRYPKVHGFISGLSILFHWSILLFLHQYHTVLMSVAL